MQETSVNQRIRILRDHLGLGRQAFAEATGLPKKTVENLEHDQQKAYQWHIEAIAKTWPQYKMWLAFGDTIPEAGQISPEIEEARQKLTKAG
ncbi:MAG: helix-turn-helix domain-containing protein [Gammaproteobacteria bacterium]